jgi:hypothetical protein
MGGVLEQGRPARRPGFGTDWDRRIGFACRSGDFQAGRVKSSKV